MGKRFNTDKDHEMSMFRKLLNFIGSPVTNSDDERRQPASITTKEEGEIVGLKKLLSFVASCTYLFLDNRFRFADSHVTQSFDGNCDITLQSQKMKIRLIRDRGQISMDFRAASGTHEEDWYSIDIVRQMITGEKECSGLMDTENTLFLRQNIDAIENLFTDEALPMTRTEMRRLEMARAKRLFG